MALGPVCVCKMTGPVVVHRSFHETQGMVSLYITLIDIWKCSAMAATQWPDGGSFVDVGKE